MACYGIRGKPGDIIGIAYQVQCRWRSEYGANKSDLSTQQALHAITREGFHPLLYKGARYARSVYSYEANKRT